MIVLAPSILIHQYIARTLCVEKGALDLSIVMFDSYILLSLFLFLFKPIHVKPFRLFFFFFLVAYVLFSSMKFFIHKCHAELPSFPQVLFIKKLKKLKMYSIV